MNFCSNIMGAKIESSCISSDGFEVENLIESRSKKVMGFQAERFARTPVFITIQFSIPIQVKCIIVTPFIGRQCAKNVHIYVLNCFKNFETDHAINAGDVTFRAGTIELHQSSSVRFNNKHFRTSCDIDDSPDVNEQQLVVDMQGKLHHVVAVKVAVMSMCSGSVPSMRRIEVWGVPASSCRKAKELVKKWREDIICGQISHQPAFNGNDIPSANITTSTKEGSVQTSEKHKQSSVPKEFIDPLMFTLMRNPVLLPSGQTIDRSTLDKHVLTQTEWGRPPTDPFTGILFTETYQPVPNVTLKLKLDQYAMSESPAPSSGECSSTPNQNCVHAQTAAVKQLRNNVTSLIPALKSSDKGMIDETAESCPYKVTPHPSSRRTLRIQPTTNNPLRCCKCRTLFSLIASQYTLPCRHRLCRSCLVAVTFSLICPQCTKPFERKQVSRTHS